MDIHSLSNETPPVKIVNRSLLLYERNSYYYNGKSKPSYKNGKENCEPPKIIKNKPYREKNSYNEKECKAKRARWKKEQARKDRENARKKKEEDQARKDKENARKKKEEDQARKDENARKKKEEDKKKTPPPQLPPNNNNDPPNNNDKNPINNNPPLTSTPPGLMDPTNTAGASGFSPTSTNAVPALPSEIRPISVAGISVIIAVLLGVVVLVGLAVYRKRYNLRRGAVRLYDDPDQNDPDTSVRPRYLSSISNMRSLRIPSMPPKVQLTRLSSATILLPFRDNYSAPSNNNGNNNYLSPSNNNVYLSPSINNVNNNYLSPSINNVNNNYLSPSNNNGNNNYLSPYTRVHPQPSSNLSSSSFTISDYQGPDSQKTDSVQSVQSSPSSHESYTSLESSFPIPPQRAVDDYNNTTPTTSTFGDMYKLK